MYLNIWNQNAGVVVWWWWWTRVRYKLFFTFFSERKCVQQEKIRQPNLNTHILLSRLRSICRRCRSRDFWLHTHYSIGNLTILTHTLLAYNLDQILVKKRKNCTDYYWINEWTKMNIEQKKKTTTLIIHTLTHTLCCHSNNLLLENFTSWNALFECVCVWNQSAK